MSAPQEPDRAAVTSAPAVGGGKGVAQAMPPRPEPIPQSPAGAQLPPTRAADCDPAPDAAPHRAAGPAGETDPLDQLVEIGQAMGDYDAPGYIPPPDIAEHRAKVLAGDDDLTIPPHLRRGTAANARARGLA